MNFFHNQDIARRKTKYLVILYLLAVIALICLANVVIAFCLLSTGNSSITRNFFSWERFGLVGLGVTATIVCAIVYKWISIGDGGRSVAESLGGSRIPPDSSRSDQRRILNVVEEMALASGMPVPPVYLMADERGINAFAAGKTVADAVIGITQGTLDQLNREQLQGVIGHEFSHILNGDMRLNMRLIALLNGILFIGGTGQFILRGSRFTMGSSPSKRFSGGRLALLGVAMVVIGWLGTFFGGLIKAAINRQREYLADASAVQFTRNPAGIADALKIIGGYSPGSRVLSAGACETSHMFIGNALSSFETVFNTHPPLEKRIEKLEPDWDGQMLSRKVVYRSPDKSGTVSVDPKRNIATTAILAGVLGGGLSPAGVEPLSSFNRLPPKIVQGIKEPFAAMALVYALLLDADSKVRERQINILQSRGAQGVSEQSTEFAEELSGMDPALRFVLVEKAMPALKCFSKGQYISFKKILLLLIKEDKRVDLFEWCLLQVIKHYLGAEFGDNKVSEQKYKYINDVADEFNLILSTIVYHGNMDEDIMVRAFNRGANGAGLYNAVQLDKKQCSMKKFTQAVTKLADCYPLLKLRILKGLLSCIEFDDKITAGEREIVTTIAAVMDSPMPRINFAP